MCLRASKQQQKEGEKEAIPASLELGWWKISYVTVSQLLSATEGLMLGYPA